MPAGTKSRLNLRQIALLLILAALGRPLRAATPVTVEQLRGFLSSSWTHRAKDSKVAERLASVVLSEQLTESALRQILLETAVGPQTREQLSLLAAASALHDPPQRNEADFPAPDSAQQKLWIDAVVGFANGYLQRLPDFLATRLTESYENTPQPREPRHAPRIALHWVGESRREMTYRNGSELAAEGGSGYAPARALTLRSWGEFGAVLRTALSDAFPGDVQFKRWDTQTLGLPVAVLHFTVPRSSSHYLVDFCCYQTDENSGWAQFRDTPGYHADIYFDPKSGRVVRLRLEAELQPDDAVTTSGIVVDYVQVSIAGKDYVCPVKSLAILIAQSREMKAIDGEGLVTHLNITSFREYRKFGSTARILPTDTFATDNPR